MKLPAFKFEQFRTSTFVIYNSFFVQIEKILRTYSVRKGLKVMYLWFRSYCCSSFLQRMLLECSVICVMVYSEMRTRIYDIIGYFF